MGRFDDLTDAAVAGAPLPEVPAPGASGSRFDDLTDAAVRQQRNSGAALAVSLESQANPDRAAEALALARRYGMPAAVTEQFVEDYKARAKAEDARKAFDAAPKLGEWVAENPERAKIAHDDLDNLSGIEIAIRRLGDAGEGLVGQGVGGILRGFGELYDVATRAIAAPIKAMGGPLDEFLSQPAPNPGQVLFGAPGQFLGQVGARMGSGDKTFAADVSRGIGQLGGQVAVQVATGGAASLATLFAQGADIMKTKTAGDDASQASKDIATMGAGAVTAITEKYALDKILGPMAVPVKNQIAAALARIGIAASAEGAQEMAENVAHDALRKLLTNESAEFSSFGEIAYEGGVGATVGGIARAAIEAALHVRSRGSNSAAQAAQAEAGAQQAEALAQFAAASKVMGRDAETVREFVAQVADEQGDAPTEFFVDAEQLVNVLNQSGMTAQEFEALAPVAAGQMNEPGGLVRMPMSEFVGMGEAAASLIDHIRTAEDMPSRAEAREFFESDQGAALKAEVDRELSALTERDAFQQDVEKAAAGFRADLDAAGRFTPEANKFLAALPANYYAATAKRLGITVDEFLDRYQLRSTSKAVKARLGDAAMSQAAGLPDVEGAAARVAQQERMNADRAEKLPADHPLVATGKRALARLKAELESATALRAGFDAWFSGSKVVSDSGKPLVVYHGTTHDITTFRRKPNGRALWASSAEVAGTYAGDSQGANVMPVYMAMRNPLIVDVGGASWQELRFEGERLSTDGLADIAEERGYDGLIIRNLRDENTDDGGSEAADHYAVFKPEQIKSAIGNRGTYDPADPNILNQSAQRDMIELRKREAVLKRLLECL